MTIAIFTSVIQFILISLFYFSIFFLNFISKIYCYILFLNSFFAFYSTLGSSLHLRFLRPLITSFFLLSSPISFPLSALFFLFLLLNVFFRSPCLSNIEFCFYFSPRRFSFIVFLTFIISIGLFSLSLSFFPCPCYSLTRTISLT